MLRHLGIHQVKTYTTQTLNDMEDQLQVIQVGQGGYVIDNRLMTGRVTKTRDLPAFTVADRQCRADNSIG